MRGLFIVVAATGALLVSLPAIAQPTPDDALTGAVDPYHNAYQRNAFLSAAGVDSELNAEELAADAKSGKGFARSYDRVDQMLRFDKNGNKTIDWFEANAYREDLRRRVLAQFDADQNQRLTGEERTKALAALNAGKLAVGGGDGPDASRRGQMNAGGDLPAGGAAPPDGRQGARDRWAQMQQQYDTDGDGQLSDEERRAMRDAMREQWRQRQLQQYDTDGDGQLSDAERRAARRGSRPAVANVMEDWMRDQFDDDGDGQLSDAERRASRQFERELQQRMRGKWESHLMDADGDGQITQEERSAAMAGLASAGMQMFTRMQTWMDSDGDGQVSREERRAVEDRVADTVAVRMVDYTNTFDEDGDGRLNAAERTTFMDGIDKEWDQRFAEHDANKNGLAEPAEMMAVMEQFAKDMGVAPPDVETPKPDDQPR